MPLSTGLGFFGKDGVKTFDVPRFIADCVRQSHYLPSVPSNIIVKMILCKRTTITIDNQMLDTKEARNQGANEFPAAAALGRLLTWTIRLARVASSFWSGCGTWSAGAIRLRTGWSPPKA